MTAQVAAEVVPLDRAETLRDAWNDLAARGLEPSIFAEAGFVLPAAFHLAKGSKPVVIAVWLGGIGRSLIAVAPVARPSLGAVGPAKVWTHPQAVAALPLLDRDHAALAWSSMLEAVRALPGRPAALLLEGVAAAGATADLIRSNAIPRIVDQRSRAVLRLGPAGAEPGSKAGKEARRQKRRLAEQGTLVSATAAQPDIVAAALDRFLALEAEGWKGKGGTALSSHPATRAFVRAALGELAARGQVSIDSLDLDGEPIAMGVVLRSGDRAFFWKTAFSERFARFSPGLQLTLQLTDRLERDRSFTLADSCAIPGHSMIDRVWPDRIAVVDMLVPTGPGRTWRYERDCRAETLRRSLRSWAKRLRDRVRGRRP